MLKWLRNRLKWWIAPDEMAEVERWRVRCSEYDRWLARYPDIALVLQNLRGIAQGQIENWYGAPAEWGPVGIHALRQQVERLRTPGVRAPDAREALRLAEIGLANAASYEGRAMPEHEVTSVKTALQAVRGAHGVDLPAHLQRAKDEVASWPPERLNDLRLQGEPDSPCFACNGTGRDLGVDHAPGVKGLGDGR